MKDIIRFKRLATLRKRDVSREIFQSNLIENEIVKNNNLINQINLIMDDGVSKSKNKSELISAGNFKNNTQLLSTLQNQKNIAKNRQDYLNKEKNLIQLKISKINLKKIKAEEKSEEYKKTYRNYIENKN